MIKDKNRIKTILFITLSNIGDIILTTPVFKCLYSSFPEAKIDVITGSSGRELFSSSPFVSDVIVRERPKNIFSRIKNVLAIRRKKYDLVIDLKNSMLPYLSGARFHSRSLFFSGRKKLHKKQEHLEKLRGLVEYLDYYESNKGMMIPVSIEDEEQVSEILRKIQEHHLNHDQIKKIVVINSGAKSHLKRWGADKFAVLIDRLFSELDCEIILTGNKDDQETIKRVRSTVKHPVNDLACKTSLGALFSLMEKADLCITNDSAPLHVASAAGIPTIAVFGPTDERKYGPLSPRRMVVKTAVECRPCEKAQCELKKEQGCIQDITVNEVFEAAKAILEI